MQAKRILLQTKATGRTGCANRKKYVIKNHEASGNFFFVPNLIARLFLSEMIHSFHQTSNDQSNSKAGLATLSCTSVRHFAFLQRRRRKPFFDWAVPQEAQLKGYNSNSTFISSFPPPPRERCSCQICESRQIDVFSEMRYTDDLCTRKCCKFERTSNKSLSSSAINTLCYPCNIKPPLGLESSMRYTCRCFVSQQCDGN